MSTPPRIRGLVDKLERAANVIWQESVSRTGLSSKLSDELRALLQS